MLSYLTEKNESNIKIKERKLDLEERKLKLEEKRLAIEEMKWKVMMSNRGYSHDQDGFDL